MEHVFYWAASGAVVGAMVGWLARTDGAHRIYCEAVAGSASAVATGVLLSWYLGTDPFEPGGIAGSLWIISLFAALAASVLCHIVRHCAAWPGSPAARARRGRDGPG